MESCARLVTLLPEFAEESLPHHETSRVRLHLDACEACRRRVVGHHRTLAALESLPQVVPPETLRHSVMERVRRDPLRKMGSRDHLRLVKVLFGIGIGLFAASVGFGAALISRTSWISGSFAEPSLLTDWMITLGQAAFSLLAGIATGSEIPPLATPRGLLAWHGLWTVLLTVMLTAMAAGFGALATVRLLSRRPTR
ncbi:MAG TPA: zf-HC2 domain-containing protein [Candidatus Polarisedimenticolia bacterium]|nr:zf-HC2 domain-containing protein [Candidatus Polarisedimenticolia bacterium]